MIKMADLPEKKRENNNFVNAQEGCKAVGTFYFEKPNPANTYFIYLFITLKRKIIIITSLIK